METPGFLIGFTVYVFLLGLSALLQYLKRHQEEDGSLAGSLIIYGLAAVLTAALYNHLLGLPPFDGWLN